MKYNQHKLKNYETLLDYSILRPYEGLVWVPLIPFFHHISSLEPGHAYDLRSLTSSSLIAVEYLLYVAREAEQDIMSEP